MKHSPHVPASPLSSRRHDITAGALVFALTLLAYLPALTGTFIWNDTDYVTNPALRSFSGLVRIWTEFGATEQYYPLLHSAFWAQQRLWGDQAFGYHLVTLLAHAGCAVLFGSILRRLTVPGAWIAAALFALHPVHVESVAWISEQKNTLSLLLYLASARVYLEYDAERRPRDYTLAAALFGLSLLCKTATATLPAALLVVFWWRRGSLGWKRDLRPLLSWLLAGAAAGLCSSWIERHLGGANGAEFTAPWLERVLIAGRAVWFYLGSLVWPFNLNFVYPRWSPDAGVSWQWIYPLAAVALVAGLWTLRRRSRAPLATLLLFAGSLFPVLGFVNLYGARYSWVWDHWQYLPDLAPLTLAGAALALGIKKLDPAWERLGQAAIAGLFALLATLTWQHSREFHDDETLYRATLRRNPDCWMAHANLAVLLASDPARRAEVLGHFETALRLKPDSADIHNSLAQLLAQDPDSQAAARKHYDAALRLDPNLATAHNNLGRLLCQTGESETAVAEFRRALECNPRLASAGANLGTVLCALNRPAEAVPVLQQALAAEPTLAAAHLALGNALRALARPTEAEPHLREALRLDLAAVDVRISLAELLLEQDNLAAALPLLRDAVAKDPASAEAHCQLGKTLLRIGNTTDGLAQLREAVRLRPRWTPAHHALGNALARAGDMPGAIQEFRSVLEVEPDDFRARNNLANALLASERFTEAEREYEVALRQQPGNQAIRDNLRYVRELLQQRSGR